MTARHLLRASGVAWRDLRLYPLRTLLVACTLFIGVSAVVAIAVASDISRDIFVANEEMKTGRAPSYAGTMSMATPTGESTLALARHTRALASGGGMHAIVTAEGSVEAGVVPPNEDAARDLRTSVLNTTWVYGNYNTVRRLPILDGAGLGPPRQAYPMRLLMNRQAARAVGGVGTHLALLGSGSTMRVRATVVGVVADGAQDPVAYGPLASALQLDPDLVAPGGERIHLHAPELDAASATQLFDDVATDTGAQIGENVHRIDSTVEIEAQLQGQRTAFLISAALALSVAAVGMLNIGLASVRERSHELSLRRAIGARRSDLIGTVVLSTVLVALIVSGLAVALAILVVELLPGLLPADQALTDPSMPWDAAVIGIAAAVATALVGSSVPAVVAGRLDPASVLRD